MKAFFLYSVCLLPLLLAADEKPSAARRVVSTSVKTYALVTPDTQPVLEGVKAVLGEEGWVHVHKARNELIISTTDAGHKRVADLLKEINKRPANVRIQVSFKGRNASTDSGVGVSGSGKVIITPKGTTYRIKPKVDIRSQKTVQTTRNVQSILVQSGREGTIFVGQDVPFITWLTHVGREWGYIGAGAGAGQPGWAIVEQEIEWRSVGASLRVEPRVIGNGPLIALRITPELSGMIKDPDGKLDKRLRRIRYARVSTEVIAQHGKPLSLGSVLKHRDFYDRFLVGVDASGRRESLNITLTPTIEDAKGQ